MGNIFDYLQTNPQYGLLLTIGLVVFYLIGLIKNWHWTLLSSSNSDMTTTCIEIFGRKAVRIAKGIIAIILLISLGFMYSFYL